MEDIKSEIQKMTGTQTAVSVEGVTLWQRLLTTLRVWWQIRQLPKGQRFVRAGFKGVTLAGLRERFAVASFNANLQLSAFKLHAQKEGLNWDDVVKWELAERFQTELDNFFVTLKSGEVRKFVPRGRKPALAVVKITPLSKYVHGEIPPRCLASVKRAKRMGLSKFYVAFPVIESVPEKDPVIIAKWEGDVYDETSVALEIDFWE